MDLPGPCTRDLADYHRSPESPHNHWCQYCRRESFSQFGLYYYCSSRSLDTLRHLGTPYLAARNSRLDLASRESGMVLHHLDSVILQTASPRDRYSVRDWSVHRYNPWLYETSQGRSRQPRSSDRDSHRFGPYRASKDEWKIEW